MKKLMFTAIALVAFTNISIAENKVVKKDFDKINKNNELVIKKDCAKVAALMCEFCEEIMDECASSQDYNDMFILFEYICNNS